MKIFLISVMVLVGFIGLSALGMALNIITIPWLKLGRQVSTERGIIEKTYNAENALYNYRWFKERAEAIKALATVIGQTEREIKNFLDSAGARDKWTFEDKAEDSRLRSVKQGQMAQYENIVAEYNARAKEVDRAIFKDELPLFFNINPSIFFCCILFSLLITNARNVKIFGNHTS